MGLRRALPLALLLRSVGCMKQRARALARMSGDTVPYDGPLAPGAIIVDPKRRLKYRVLPGGQAERRPMRSALDMSWAER